MGDIKRIQPVSPSVSDPSNLEQLIQRLTPQEVRIVSESLNALITAARVNVNSMADRTVEVEDPQQAAQRAQEIAARSFQLQQEHEAFVAGSNKNLLELEGRFQRASARLRQYQEQMAMLEEEIPTPQHEDSIKQTPLLPKKNRRIGVAQETARITPPEASVVRTPASLRVELPPSFFRRCLEGIRSFFSDFSCKIANFFSTLLASILKLRGE